MPGGGGGSSSRGTRREKHVQSSKRRSFSTAHADALQLINPLLRCEEVYFKIPESVNTNRNNNADGVDFMCDRSGSQPANLENLGRRPSLQSAQSDSNLRTGKLPYSFYIL